MKGWTCLGRGGIIVLAGIGLALAGCTREKPQPTVKPWGTPLATVRAVATSSPVPTLSVVETRVVLEPGITPIASETPVSSGMTYTVQRGDNLFRIAQRFNTDVETLKRLNGLTSDFIYVGQVLRVPGVGPIVVSGPVTYVVQRGDTLAIIAQKFGVSVSDLIQANNITNPDTILVGQTLTIPTSGAAAPPSTPASRTYTVQPGDTLAKIAVRFGVTVNDLVKANDLPDPNTIRVGQVLRIP